MHPSRPIASLSLDLDNKWTYLKVRGDSGAKEFPSYLDLAVPRVLDFLSDFGLRVTFFVVGQDAALEKNHPAVRMISAAGHEIGNHSFSHEPWYHLQDRQYVESEISLAEDAIAQVTGQRPVGFRGPGYSLSEIALDILQSRGYMYDASTFPTFIGPLARLYYLRDTKLKGADLENRSQLFGSIKHGLLPLSAHRPRDGHSIMEIPVSTMPLIRTPIHLSYLLYMSAFSPALAVAYFLSALKLYELSGVSPSFLLHPLDFLGADDRVGLDFFPAMQLPARKKLDFAGRIILAFSSQFKVVSLREHALLIVGQLGDQLTEPSAPSRSASSLVP